MSSLDSFKEAFSGKSSSMWVHCECGEEFGSQENSENMLTSNWYGLIEFEGCQYVEECVCWKERARKIAEWIDGHKHEIADYLRLEKVRLTEFANAHPTVDLRSAATTESKGAE